MPTATIAKVWRDHGQVFIAAVVDEVGGNIGRVEYHASVPDDADFAALTTPQKKAALMAAVKVIRDEQRAVPQDVTGITGTATV